MNIKVVKTKEQYESYLHSIESLLLNEKSLSVEENDRLEILTVLVDNYENSNYPIEQIDPIDAIKFRMEERGLKQSDLTPYFGTKSRVSEVLRRNRPLTVTMIRALSLGLGISAETLIRETTPKQKDNSEFSWSNFPAKEMKKRGWFTKNEQQKSIEEQVKEFIGQFDRTANAVAFKRTLKGDSYSPGTEYAVYAWLTRVVQKARLKKTQLGKYDRKVITPLFLKELSQISWFDSGPKLAVEFLEKHGICVVTVPQLKGTLIDGAAFKDEHTPIIALTLRHDRLDNFWFTLMHELIHIWKHIDNDETFIDDMEHNSKDKIEAQANRIARDTFIPRAVWKRSNAFLSPSKATIYELSKELRIHPSIIAGRIRREKSDYTKFTDLIGHGEVKKQFEDL